MINAGRKLTPLETEELEEADRFKAAYRDNKTTFAEVMNYLRKQSDLYYRQRCFLHYVPMRIKNKVEIQCKLERLL